MNACATCRHWAERPLSTVAGQPGEHRACGAILNSVRTAVFPAAFLSAWQPRDAPRLITRADFGCTLHEPRAEGPDKARSLAKQLREAMAHQSATPPEERFRQMVDQGAIDAEGNVLIRGPQSDPSISE